MLLKLLLVAASVLLSSLAARRFGHAVGGTLAGLPMIAGPIMGFLLLQASPDEVGAIAHATLVCLPASVLFMLVFAWTAMRRRWPVALLLANLAFLALGSLLPLVPLPPGVAAPLAIAVLAAGAFGFPRLPLVAGSVAIPRTELACRVAAAIVLAWVIVRSAGIVPAAVSGLLLAVPITGNVLPCFTLPRHGAAATVALLRGFVRGLTGFAVFFAVLQVGLARWPAGVVYAAAWAAAIGVAAALSAVQTRLRPPALAA